MAGQRPPATGGFELVRGPRHIVRCDGELLRRYRAAWSQTLVDAARAAGISVQALRNAERGLAVEIETANRLAEQTGIPLETLLVAMPAQDEAALAEHGLKAPLPPTLLVGREKELASIVGYLRGSNSTAVLSGVSGIGKSALARKVAASLRPDLPGGVVWVDAAQINSDERVIAAQRRIAMALGFAARMPEGGAVRPEAFAESFQLLFWSQPRLLVLDDVTSARVYRLFHGDAVSGHRVLVTTRLRSVAEQAAGREFRVGALTQAAADALLANYIGAERLEADPSGTQRLREVLGGVPRAVHVAGRVLARERYTQLGDFAAQYGGSHNGFFAGGRDSEWSRAEISDVHHAGSVERFLTSEALRLFGQLQIFGNHAFPLDWAEALSSEPPHAVRRGIAELVDLFVLDDVTASSASRGPFQVPRFRRSDADRLRVPVSQAERDAVSHRLAGFLTKRVAEYAALPRSERAARFAGELECWVAWMESVAVELLVPSDVETWSDPGSLTPVWCPPGSPRAVLAGVVEVVYDALSSIPGTLPIAALVAALKVDAQSAPALTRARLASHAADYWIMERRDPVASLRWIRVATDAAAAAGGGVSEWMGRVWQARMHGICGDLDTARTLFLALIAEAEASSGSSRRAARLYNDLGLQHARVPSSDVSEVHALFEQAVARSELAGSVSQFGAPVTSNFPVDLIYRANLAVWGWVHDPVGSLAALRTACIELFPLIRNWPPYAARLYAMAAVAGFGLDGMHPEYCGEAGHRLLAAHLSDPGHRHRLETFGELELLAFSAWDHVQRSRGEPATLARIYAPVERGPLFVEDPANAVWTGALAQTLPGLLLPHAASVELLRRDRNGAFVELLEGSLGREHPRTQRFASILSQLEPSSSP